MTIYDMAHLLGLLKLRSTCLKAKRIGYPIGAVRLLKQTDTDIDKILEQIDISSLLVNGIKGHSSL